jgi:serine/threonine-protein kinase
VESLIGQEVNGYQIIGLIGKGGMGEVYEATSPQGQNVAIKILRSEGQGLPKEWVERFVREVHLMETLQHPNIVPIYDYGYVEETDTLYFTMKYITGPTLTRLLEARQFSPDAAWYLLKQIAAGLAYGHAQGVMHRDIKPDNILLMGPEEAYEAYVADFGIGKKPGVDHTLTEVGSVLGTPTYMSPEAVLGEKMDIRADVYSLGIMAYEMLLGIPPYKESHSHLTAMAHVTKPLTPPSLHRPDFPLALEPVLLRALDKDRNQRYQTVDAFAADFEQAMDSLDDDDRLCQFWV